MILELPYIEIEQPIGNFYLTKLRADTLSSIVNVIPRSKDNEKAIQREESKKRIQEIAEYCSDPDATFPTPIIISIYESVDINRNKYVFEIEIDNNKQIGEVIDGQHRLRGIQKSAYAKDFELPVVLMFNLTEEEKAYVFSIINSKQTKVSSSLIYDLFSLSQHRSPTKTAHEIARALNRDPESPLYKRLKMLGKKIEGENKATLSQGSFVKHLIGLISKNPDRDYRLSKMNKDFPVDKSLPLRDYFIQDRDEIILKILTNLFEALKDTFPQQWKDPNDNILWKTTGYIAIIKAFPKLYDLGRRNNDLSYNFFRDVFDKFDVDLESRGLSLTSDDFPSNAQQQSRLSKILIESAENIYN